MQEGLEAARLASEQAPCSALIFLSNDSNGGNPFVAVSAFKAPLTSSRARILLGCLVVHRQAPPWPRAERQQVSLLPPASRSRAAPRQGLRRQPSPDRCRLFYALAPSSAVARARRRAYSISAIAPVVTCACVEQTSVARRYDHGGDSEDPAGFVLPMPSLAAAP